jgi:uracil-DNA glycosylase
MPAESKRCNAYLVNELQAMPKAGAILALGRIAHDAVLHALGARASAIRSGMAHAPG